MKSSLLSERLLEVIRTKDDANTFVVQIDTIISHLFTNASSPIDVMTAFMPYAKKEWILSLIHERDLDIANPEQIQVFFQTVKETVKKFPVVEITLAFEPAEGYVRTLSEWFLAHCKKPVLMDMHYNLAIIGGAILAYKGTYKDYSIGKLLKEKQEKGEIHTEV